MTQAAVLPTIHFDRQAMFIPEARSLTPALLGIIFHSDNDINITPQHNTGQHVTTLKINWIRIKITLVTLTLYPGV